MYYFDSYKGLYLPNQTVGRNYCQKHPPQYTGTWARIPTDYAHVLSQFTYEQVDFCCSLAAFATMPDVNICSQAIGSQGDRPVS